VNARTSDDHEECSNPLNDLQNGIGHHLGLFELDVVTCLANDELHAVGGQRGELRL
jgi:hypothetical protein